MNNFGDRLNELQLKLRKTWKLHGAQVEVLKQKLSAISLELQALQTSIGCELSEVEQLLDRLERSHRSDFRQLPPETFDGSKPEPSYRNGNSAEALTQ